MFDTETYPIITDTTKLDKKIATLSEKYSKLRPELHQMLVSAVVHAARTRDTTRLTNFYDLLSNEINKGKGIAIWLQKYTNLTYRKGTDEKFKWLKPMKASDVILYQDKEAKTEVIFT